MTQKKKWVGICQNDCKFQGEIVGDPQVVPGDKGDFIFLTLRTIILNRSENGQIVECPQEIPLMVEPNSPAHRVAKEFIQDERKILAAGEYKTWKTETGLEHKFAISRIILGDKPYVPQDGSGAPNLPK